MLINSELLDSAKSRSGNMNRIAVTFALLCVSSSTLAFNFEDCGSEVGKFGDIKLSIELQHVRGEMHSESRDRYRPKDVTKIELRAFGVLLDVPVPVPPDEPDACKDSSSGLKCPLKKDEEVEYKTTFFVDKSIPTMDVDVIYEFANEDDQRVICVKLPATLK